MHSSLKFTMEKESDHQLAFLDVFVHKTSTAFLTSVYRKPNFSGLYARWDSFCPQQRCNVMAEGFRFMPLGLVWLRTFRLSAWVT